MIHEVLSLRLDLIILASKWDDPDIASSPGQLGDPIRVKAGAGHKVVGMKLVSLGLKQPTLMDSLSHRDLLMAVNLIPGGLDLLDENGRDLAVVDDPFLGNLQRRPAGDVGLDLTHRLGFEPLQAFQPVCLAPRLEIAEPLDFGFVHRHHDLATDIVMDPVMPTELDHFPDALDSEPGLDRSRFVVEAAVKDAAVVPGLMSAGPALLLKDHDVRLREESSQLVCRGETDDPAADHDDALWFHA